MYYLFINKWFYAIKGAVPILTLNPQRVVDVLPSMVPDNWHHQMMHGIAYCPFYPEISKIYLTNPLSEISMKVLRPQLFSPSALMIKKEEVLSRWTPCTDLVPLATQSNSQWETFNVLGIVT